MSSLKSYSIVSAVCILLFLGWSYYSHSNQSYKIKDALLHDNVLPVLIVGSGVAGLSASIYIARFGIKSVVCDDIWCIESIDDEVPSDKPWPGFDNNDSHKKRHADMKVHTMGFGTVIVNHRITYLDLKQWPFMVRMDNGTELKALSVILATGCDGEGNPNNDLFEGEIALDEDGYVILDGRSHRASRLGVFAAGSIHDGAYDHPIISASDGAKSAIDCKTFLMEIGLTPVVQKQLEDRFFVSLE